MYRWQRVISLKLVLFLIWFPFRSVFAQSSVELPVYIVQSGDTINTIASRFGISAQDLIAVNQIANPDLLTIGTPLKIPGYEGITGTLTLTVAPLGANLSSISKQFQVEKNTIIRLNQLTSPAQIYVGSTLILPQQDQSIEQTALKTMGRGETILETAASFSENPWKLILLNQ